MVLGADSSVFVAWTASWTFLTINCVLFIWSSSLAAITAAAFELADDPYYEEVPEIAPDLQQIQYDIDNLYAILDYVIDAYGVSHEEVSTLKIELDEAQNDVLRMEEYLTKPEEPQKKYLSDPDISMTSDWEEYLAKNPYPYERR